MKLENEVEAEIARFLHKLYWRRYRNHVGQIDSADGATRVIGKRGTPDWTYRRTISGQRGRVEILHVECKREGHTPYQDGERGKGQLERIASLNAIGEPACWANSLEMFELWYWTQGFAP